MSAAVAWARRFFDLGASGESDPVVDADAGADTDFEIVVLEESPAAAPAPAPAPDPPAQPAPPAPPAPPAVLVFDTETTGLKDPLAVQIAWVVYDPNGTELWTRAEYLALPPGRRIDPGAEKVHRISLRTLEAKGKAPQFVLADFFADVDRIEAAQGKLVAHNAKFDARVVTNTATSCGLARDLVSDACFCTMQTSKQRLGLKNSRGGLKVPKNTELHEALVGPVPAGTRLHEALADVRITAASYFAGQRQRWW